MNDPAPLSDVRADEALLDRLGARTDAEATEPVAGLLAALGVLADEPVGPQGSTRATSHRRTFRSRRSVAAAGLLAVALSGAGVAAAMTLPDLGAPAPAPVRTSRSAKPVKPIVPQQLGRVGASPSKSPTTPATSRTGAATDPPSAGLPQPRGGQSSESQPIESQPSESQPSEDQASEDQQSGSDPAGTSRTGTPLPPSGTDDGADDQGQAGQPGASAPRPVRGGTPPGPAAGRGTTVASVPAQAAHGQQQGAAGQQANSSDRPGVAASAKGRPATPATTHASAAAGSAKSGIPSGAEMGSERKGTSQGSSGRQGSSTR